MPVSIDATPEEVAYRLEDAQCVAIFSRAAHADALRRAFPDIAVIHFEDGVGEAVAHDKRVDGRPTLPRDPPDMERPAFIVYTSGTTGRAKGVVLTLQGMLWVTAACWTPIAGLSADDYVLNALPLYHSYALNLAVVSILATGASEYIMDGFSASRMAEIVAEEPITVLPGVPTVFHYLLERGKEAGRRELARVRICLSGWRRDAGPAQRRVRELVRRHVARRLRHHRDLDHGHAELGHGLAHDGLLRAAPSGAGDTESSTSRTAMWPPGSEGELIVRGPNVMLGYHGNPEATAPALRDGWYRTGDLARADKFGFLTITGRLKEVIIRGGQNISPGEVEEAIGSHEGVLDCAVVGISHEFLGEVPVAFVIAREGHTVDEASVNRALPVQDLHVQGSTGRTLRRRDSKDRLGQGAAVQAEAGPRTVTRTRLKLEHAITEAHRSGPIRGRRRRAGTELLGRSRTHDPVRRLVVSRHPRMFLRRPALR